jgi:glycosyltransferase involved in cell wall biosynthesis
MNRRVLLVSPHFPPVNAPDMQRARQALPHLAASGWDVEVLAVDPAAVDAPHDPLLAQALPPGIPVHRVRALSPRVGRWLGRGTLARRALGPLGTQGDALLRTGRFDLVFFTTTQFSVLRLGPHWRARFRVPYVVDWQDPWVTDFYVRPGAPQPPGGWRYRFAQAEARRHEGPCLAAASGWVGTSESYRADLAARHPGFARLPQAVIPFGFEPEDFAAAERFAAPVPLAFEPGVRNIVYVGAAGPIMEPALTTLFAALRGSPGGAAGGGVRFHFVGTSYAPAGREQFSVQPLAERCGVGAVVRERPARVPFFSALRTLRAADALLLLGSTDAGYNPSKIGALLHAGKPILAVVASETLAAALRTFPAVTVARVGAPEGAEVIRRFCAQPPSADLSPPATLARISAAARTRELALLFDRARHYFETRAA